MLHTVGFSAVIWSFRQCCKIFKKNRNASNVSADNADELPLCLPRECPTIGPCDEWPIKVPPLAFKMPSEKRIHVLKIGINREIWLLVPSRLMNVIYGIQFTHSCWDHAHWACLHQIRSNAIEKRGELRKIYYILSIIIYYWWYYCTKRLLE